MNEEAGIERGTAEGFLTLYNTATGSDYEVVEVSDDPDVRCANSHGRTWNLETTTIEDRPDDTKALLGRSDARSIEALAPHSRRVGDGLEGLKFSSLSDELLTTLAGRIEKKLSMFYGPNTALVIRDTSGVDWDWNQFADEIRRLLDLSKSPFDEGIWILSRTKERLCPII